MGLPDPQSLRCKVHDYHTHLAKNIYWDEIAQSKH